LAEYNEYVSDLMIKYRVEYQWIKQRQLIQE
jgi:hypothetical protein